MLTLLNSWASALPTWVSDGMRMTTVILGPIMLGMFLSVARQVRNTRQWGMYALVCFGLNGILRSFDGWGDPATYSTVLNFAGVVLGCVFLVKTFRLHGAPDHNPPRGGTHG